MGRPAPTQAPGPLFTEQVSVPERTVQEHTQASQVDRIATNQASGRGTSVSPLGWPRVPLPEQRCGDMGCILSWSRWTGDFQNGDGVVAHRNAVC